MKFVLKYSNSILKNVGHFCLRQAPMRLTLSQLDGFCPFVNPMFVVYVTYFSCAIS